MLDSIRIMTRDKETALGLAEGALARFRPQVVHERKEWELLVESESEDDLPDLIGILEGQLRDAKKPVEVLVNGETYPLRRAH